MSNNNRISQNTKLTTSTAGPFMAVRASHKNIQKIAEAMYLTKLTSLQLRQLIELERMIRFYCSAWGWDSPSPNHACVIPHGLTFSLEIISFLACAFAMLGFLWALILKPEAPNDVLNDLE